MTTATKHLSSIGRLAELFQRMPAEIEAAARGVQVEPDVTINGVKYFTDRQAEAIRRELQKPKGSA